MNQSAIATLVDRSSRYVRLVHLPADHGAKAVRDGLAAWLAGLRGTVDDPVGDQGIAAPQGEPVRCGSAQSNGGHLTVELADRH